MPDEHIDQYLDFFSLFFLLSDSFVSQKMLPIELSQLQNALLNWFAEHQRDLPWRKNYKAYGVWISEMMLQQTRVATVLDYYDRWMRALPSIPSVATAEEGTIFKLWEGLGYYARARNIHRAAKQICEQHAGEFPNDYEAIRQLPGIGPYTAGAITSIAFEQDRPIVDGNVIRVLCRLLNLDADPKAGSTQKKLWQVATDWLPKGRARNFNQGLMELGATVCYIQQPSCLLCPIQPHCQAYIHQTTAKIPRRVQRKAPTPVTKAVLVLVCENKVLLRRPEQGLMQGLWAFPETLVKEEEPLVELQAEWQRRNRPNFQLQTNWPTLTHVYTTFLATLHPFYCTLTSIQDDFTLEAEEQWHPLPSLQKLAMAKAHGRLRQSLLNQNDQDSS